MYLHAAVYGKAIFTVVEAQGALPLPVLGGAGVNAVVAKQVIGVGHKAGNGQIVALVNNIAEREWGAVKLAGLNVYRPDNRSFRKGDGAGIQRVSFVGQAAVKGIVNTAWGGKGNASFHRKGIRLS